MPLEPCECGTCIECIAMRDIRKTVFTDEDLKRLKEGMLIDPLWHVEGAELKALIARLEAAEVVCQAVVDQGYYLWPEVQPWRKAAGKQ